MVIGNVKSKYVFESSRLNSDFHLSAGVQYDRFFRSRKHHTLRQLATEIFCAGRSKRIYVEPKYGLPYLGNTDLSASSPTSDCNYTSKKFWKEKKGLLTEGMILTGRVGQNTVGSYQYASKEIEGCVGSDNVIRIISNGRVKSGYLFSFLSTKYGYYLSRRHISGNAQPFITEEMLSDLPVPVISDEIETIVHKLILKATYLRVDANKQLSEVHEKLQKKISFKRINVDSNISIRALKNTHQSRFEAQYFVSEGTEIHNHILGMNHALLKEFCQPIFRPGIFKRHYVEKGLDFLGGSDIVKAIPRGDKKLSKIRTEQLDELIIREGWILVTCGGTIGSSVFVNKFLNGKAASQHILRIIPKNIPAGYLYAYISSNIGKKAIQRFTYGSVIPQIEPHHLELLPVPIFDVAFMEGIHEKVMDYNNKISESIKLELEAIKIVEQEIESWQK